MNKHYLINFLPIGNENTGYIIALEKNKPVKFDIKRVYYIHSVPESMQRGFHAHKSIEQILICLNGNIKVRCFDGKIEKVYELNSSNQGLYIGDMVWHEMFNYTKGAILLVLASEIYNEDDYIRNFDEFMKKVDKLNLNKKEA